MTALVALVEPSTVDSPAVERPAVPWTHRSGRWTLGRCGPADVEGLAELYRSMSDDARRLRFFQAVPVVPMSTVRWLCDVDQVRHRAWLARPLEDPRVVIGEVRGVIDVADGGDGLEAEIAVAVRDDWSGRGLGRAMVLHVMADLASAGVASARCEVLADNRRSIGLFQSIGFHFEFDHGVLMGRSPIGPSCAVVDDPERVVP